jgi:hypothetical protein
MLCVPTMPNCALTGWCMGVPENPIKAMFATFQKTSHKVCTTFDISDKMYGHGPNPPLKGFSQVTAVVHLDGRLLACLLRLTPC